MLLALTRHADVGVENATAHRSNERRVRDASPSRAGGVERFRMTSAPPAAFAPHRPNQTENTPDALLES